ncbi:Cytoplasmic tRNA 2-thiolation protein 2 [Mortierella alpina]|nr:Cytoplasmic tRNA 2-thiolation protein 2 [Mortierella alpina]
MSLYTTPKDSRFLINPYLSHSLTHLSEHAAMTLFSLKNVSVGSSQTVFNPDGCPVADSVKMTMRSSSIGSNSVDLQFYFDPYDWSFPPDLIIHGLLLSPSLADLGLDESWDHEDPRNLSKVLGKLSRMMQHGERQRVKMCDNERIQVEYVSLDENGEMDCSLIPGIDGPTKVVFAVPFFIAYAQQGKQKQLKVVAKIQYLISSLVPNDVTAAKSKLEVLSPFEYPDILQSVPEIAKHEPITSYMERASRRVQEYFERQERSQKMRKEFIETMVITFRENLLECDIVNHTYASFMFTVQKEKPATAIATFYVTESFPEVYPKLTLTTPMMPSDSFKPAPAPEVIDIRRYSPRWDAERIVNEIWEQLWEDIPRYHARMVQLSSSSAALQVYAAMSCSVEEPTMTVAEKRAKSRAVHAGFCCKCKSEKSTIIVRYAEYCDPCFLIALDSKFRTALRNARPYRVTNPENVMLAFSGGSSSRSLIHLFDVFHSLPPEVATNKQQPKIYNNIHVCHIDESCLMEPVQGQDQDSNSLAQSTMERARSIAAGYGYEFHGVHIEDIYDPEWSDSRCFDAVATLITSLPKDQLTVSGQAPELLSKILPLSTTPSERSTLCRQERIEKLNALLSACTTLTAKETILQHFRSSLLVQLTKRAQCTILALGDSATRVAIQIIGLTAIGRGYSLPHETSLLSDWIQDCKVIRPLKDCLVKELDTFCSLRQLEVIEKHEAQLDWTMRTKAEIKSIDRLTQEFITGLDKEFPSTVATVCRTAAKLTAPGATYQDRCPLCHGPVQKDVQEWKNRITVTTAPTDNTTKAALEAAELDTGCCSLNGASACCSSSDNRTSNGPSLSTSSCSQAQNYSPASHGYNNADELSFSSLLCYGCLTNLRDLDLKAMGSSNGKNEDEGTSSFDLPPYVAETLLHRLGLGSLEEYRETQLAREDDAGRAGLDPRESLREQIQEFLIESEDEEDNL